MLGMKNLVKSANSSSLEEFDQELDAVQDTTLKHLTSELNRAKEAQRFATDSDATSRDKAKKQKVDELEDEIYEFLDENDSA